MMLDFQTLTPIWTGGKDTGKVDRIHETGIIGSMRWWYETLVRGMGGKVCDLGTSKCLHHPETGKNDLCEVCQLFGTTGWKRRFRLRIIESNLQSDGSVETVRLHQFKRNGKSPSWWFPNDLNDKPRKGGFSISLETYENNSTLELIQGLLQFMSDWSALGARPQMGFGVVTPINGVRFDTQPLNNKLTSLNKAYVDQKLPSLRNVFFAQIQKESISNEEPFILKHNLRMEFREKPKDKTETNIRHFVMGTAGKNPIAAKIKMSRPYGDGVIRIWGWIPEICAYYNGVWNRDSILDKIYSHIATNYTINYWREYDSPRDSRNYSDINDYLSQLL